MNDMGVVKESAEDCSLLSMSTDCLSAKHCLCNDDTPCVEGEGTFCKEMNTEEMTQAIICSIHKLHGGQTIMMPATKWRSVFDAVAFSMAGDESWQEFDATATVRLNTQDPLLFESSDEHTLTGLITALMNDGEGEAQGVFLFPTGAPVLVHIVPSGPVKFWFGTQALADEVSEAYVS